MNQTSYESFNPNDPAFFADSCKNLIKEKVKLNKLSNKYCSKKSVILSNRDEINDRRNCYTMIEKKLNIDNEKPSWCDRVSPNQLNQIQTDISQETIIKQEQDGPVYMENQYIENNIKPNNLHTYNLSEIDKSIGLDSASFPYNLYPDYSQYLNIKSAPVPIYGQNPIPLYNSSPEQINNSSSTITNTPSFELINSSSSAMTYTPNFEPINNLNFEESGYFKYN